MAMGQVFFSATLSMTPLYFNGKAEPKNLSGNHQVAWCPASLLSYGTWYIEILISISIEIYVKFTPGLSPVILKGNSLNRIQMYV